MTGSIHGSDTRWMRRGSVFFSVVLMASLCEFGMAVPAIGDPSLVLYGDEVFVGAGPRDVVVSSDSSTAYVTNGYNGTTVSVIDAASETVTHTITVGSQPFGIAITPNGRSLLVADQGDNTVDVISTTTNTVTATITTHSSPLNVAVSPDGATAYITEPAGTGQTPGIEVINLANDTITATIATAGSPLGIAVSPDGTHVYATDGTGNQLDVIDPSTDTITGTIATGTEPTSVTTGPDGRTLYVTNDLDNTLDVINATTSTLTAVVTTGYDPEKVVVNPDGRQLYVVDGDSVDGTAPYGGVTVINATTNAVTASIGDEDHGPESIAVSPDGTRLYLVGDDYGSVYIFRTNANPEYVTAASAVSNATTEHLTIPAAVTAGNLMLLYATVNTTTALTGPAGWHLIGTTPLPATAFTSAVWWKFATATDHNTTITVGHGTGIAHGTLNLIDYTAVNPSTPIDAATGTFYPSNAATTTTTPTVTTTTAADLITSYWACKSSTVTTWNPPNGQTLRANTNDTGGGHINTLLTDRLTTTTATYGGYTATTDQTHAAAIAWTITLEPLP